MFLKAVDTLVQLYLSLYSVLNLMCFVPLLCSLVLVVKCYTFSLSTSLLCPLYDFISLMQFPCVVKLHWLNVGHANDTLH